MQGSRFPSPVEGGRDGRALCSLVPAIGKDDGPQTPYLGSERGRAVVVGVLTVKLLWQGQGRWANF